ncbi:hypothetical protein [Nonomuraea turcica]|uniref:hypothetical protein n=1 Tax=Nonomuraea sp. G32 TaxID=3067274 RepID=UPI00273A8E53|nr:hypothetical protein [Nonomuraea sp. G32]MDP4501037.1 hypothetical protein [Nonomuraea sp. G32]
MSKITADRDTYPQALHTLTSAAAAFYRIADLFDLDQLRSLCAQYQALAPIIQPPAYQQGGARRLDDQEAFLAAIHRLVEDLRKLDPASPGARSKQSREAS